MPPHVPGNKQMVINRTYNAVKLYIFFPVWGAWNVSWMLMHSTITVACSLSFHVPFSLLSPTLSNLSPFLSSESSQIFLLLLNSLPSIPVFLFSPIRILMMAGLSQFSHHLRLICDTQLCQLKPLMAQRSTLGCQSCQLWNIPVCCITQLVKEQGSGCMKFKRRLKKGRKWESRGC